jgi:hypothetical protein
MFEIFMWVIVIWAILGIAVPTAILVWCEVVKTIKEIR